MSILSVTDIRTKHRIPSRRPFAKMPLQLEPLEARCLLSSSTTPALVGGVSHDAVPVGTSSTLFTLTPSNILYEHVPATGWTELGQNVVAFSASAEKSGNVVLFAILSDQALARFDSSSGWQMIGAPGTIQSISSGTDQNG